MFYLILLPKSAKRDGRLSSFFCKFTTKVLQKPHFKGFLRLCKKAITPCKKIGLLF